MPKSAIEPASVGLLNGFRRFVIGSMRRSSASKIGRRLGISASVELQEQNSRFSAILMPVDDGGSSFSTSNTLSGHSRMHHGCTSDTGRTGSDADAVPNALPPSSPSEPPSSDS